MAKKKSTSKTSKKKTTAKKAVKKNTQKRTRKPVKSTSKAKKSSPRKKVTTRKKSAAAQKKTTRRRRRAAASQSTNSTSRPRRKKGEKYQVLSPARIKVVGIGGAGGNVVTRMMASPFKGVEFITINTDAQDLEATEAKRKIHIGKNLTRGLGTGMNPDLGRQAAEENLDEITQSLDGADMIFVTAGMGGGTGTGASPIVAEAAQKTGALVIGVVTKPFHFEGSQRMNVAEEGVARLRDVVDALITIPNDKIFDIIDPETPILKAFEKIDDVLRNSVQGISELITFPGIINVDFADVRAVMQGSGVAVVGSASHGGKERAIKAAQEAIKSPLIEIGIEGARGILFGIAGGRDLKMAEINEAAKFIKETADPESRIIFGAYHDRRLKSGAVRVTVLAAGFDGYQRTNGTLGLFENASSDEEESRPTRVPDSREENVERVQPVRSDVVDDDDAWDVPAFLRRKK